MDFGKNRPDETSRLLGERTPAKALERSERCCCAWPRRAKYFHQTSIGRVASVCGLALVFGALAILAIFDIIGEIGKHHPSLSRLGLYQRPPVPATLMSGSNLSQAVCTARVSSRVFLTASNFTIGLRDDDGGRREGPGGTASHAFLCDPLVRRRSSPEQSMWCCPFDPTLACRDDNVGGDCVAGTYPLYSFTNDSDLTLAARRPTNLHYFLLNWLSVGTLRIVLSPPSEPPLGGLCANCSWSALTDDGSGNPISGSYSRFGDNNHRQRDPWACFVGFNGEKKISTMRAIGQWCPVDVTGGRTGFSNGGFRPNDFKAKLVRMSNSCPSYCFGKTVFVELHYLPKHIGSLFGVTWIGILTSVLVSFVAFLLLLPQCVCQFARSGCSEGFILSLISVIFVPFVLFLPLAIVFGGAMTILVQTGMVCAVIFYWIVVVLTPVFGIAWKSAAGKCCPLRCVMGLLLGSVTLTLWIVWRVSLWIQALASPSLSTIALSAVLSVSWFVTAVVMMCCFRLLRTRFFECPRDVSEVFLFCTLMLGIPALLWYPLFGADQRGGLVVGSQFSVIWTRLWVIVECFVVLILFLPCPEPPCPHTALCEKFLLLQQGLRENNFDVDQTKCYCRPCLRGNFPPVTLEPRDQPEVCRRRTFPSGWVRLGLHVSKNDKGAQKRIFQNWCCAYHGTSTRNVRSIVQSGALLRAGDTTPGGDLIHVAPGHIDYHGVEDPAQRRALKNFVRSRFVTPSLKYASVYAPRAKMGKHSFQMVFEVRIQPDAINDKLPVTAPGGGPVLFAEGQQHTLSRDFGPFEDPLFPTECLEWFTHREGVIVLTGLLVKVGEEDLSQEIAEQSLS